MRWIADNSGRFGKRPFYSNEEMESECERAVSELLSEARGVVYPLSLDDLTLIVERYADLNLYDDLRTAGDDVQGVTSFASGKRPVVRIDERLSADERRVNWLRATLAHEFGHVRLHDVLFREERRGLSLLADARAGEQKCRREGIASPCDSDWMECQAGYVCTALLAPKPRVLEVLARAGPSQRPLVAGQIAAEAASRTVADAFSISLETARLRLFTVGAVQLPARQPR